MGFQFVEGKGRKPLKMWCEGVEVEEAARKQLENIASLPFVYKHIAVMPDVHLGKGATVGSVIATKGAVVPAAVGVDIGCGMMAIRLSLTGAALPDNLHSLRSAIEAVVPHGRTDNGGKNDRGTWGDVPQKVIGQWNRLADRYAKIVQKHPKIASHKTAEFMGTLGTGNHFIELCLDEDDYVWVMLHSGSRGVGNKIGQYFIEAAKKEMERYHILPYLPDQDLSYLVEHTELFDDYVEAVHWAQEFAALNRQVMMDAVIQVLRNHLPLFIVFDEKAVNCHHNYISKENHFGDNVLVTRKGAVRAREGDLGIIPGSMGTGSFIVRGLGNHESFCSCSHGAGRRMSRNEARKRIERYLAQDTHSYIPEPVWQLDENQPYVFVVDADKSRLFVYRNDNGTLQYNADFYVTIGKNGGEKKYAGDKRTPLGVYYTAPRLTQKLADMYGDAAYPLSYPNEWDKRQGKTGSGIWLHGTAHDTYSRPPQSSDGCVVLGNQDLKTLTPILQQGNVPVIIAKDIEWLKPNSSVFSSNAQDKQALLDTIENWRKDWQSQETEIYLEHYSNNFSNGSLDYNHWAEEKKRIQASKPRVDIKLSNLSVLRYPNSPAPMAVVTFDQTFRSSVLDSQMRKRQYWIFENDRWKIIYEGAA